MQYLNKQEAICKINQFALRGDPFLFIIDFTAEHSVVVPAEAAAGEGIFYNIGGKTNADFPLNRPPSFTFNIEPVTFQAYSVSFDRVMQHLRRGDTYLINLTFPTPVQTSLSLRDIFDHSPAPFKLLFLDRFVVFSPEQFVVIRNRKIISSPMKGTIDATIAGAREQLLSSKKELFEHHTIVDLIRNDLSMVSTRVRVEKFRYIERIETNKGALLQMSSRIAGLLPAGYGSRTGDVLFSLLPAGSVTGAPKGKTVEIIRDAETYDRGFYTGIFGLFDGNTLNSAVSIRFIEQAREGLVFKSGGGITALSDPLDEYEEMIKKVYVPFI
jgi:para-aminobenzoate synthetase component 1